jgi:hypothetical protein
MESSRNVGSTSAQETPSNPEKDAEASHCRFRHPRPVVLTVPDIHRDFETETQLQKFGFSPSHYRLLAQAES